MLKADIGDSLYIIIFAVLMLVGLFEKVAKAKRQQQNIPPHPPQPYDDFEDVEEQPPSQTLEEMLRRMTQTTQTHTQEEFLGYPVGAKSSEVIPEKPNYFYEPVVSRIKTPSEEETFSSVPIEEAKEATEYDFDIRQAVIASEILNRKY